MNEPIDPYAPLKSAAAPTIVTRTLVRTDRHYELMADSTTEITRLQALLDTANATIAEQAALLESIGAGGVSALVPVAPVRAA